MNRLAAGLSLMRFSSRPMSCRSPVRMSVQGRLARLMAGIAGAALLVASQSVDQSRRDASVDALHSIVPAATLPALHPIPSQRLAAQSRWSTHWSTGHAAALPAVVQASLLPDAALDGAASTSIAVCAATVSRGYDATAPPALS